MQQRQFKVKLCLLEASTPAGTAVVPYKLLTNVYNAQRAPVITHLGCIAGLCQPSCWFV